MSQHQTLHNIAFCAFFGFLTSAVSADDLKTLDIGGISIDLRLIDRDRLELHADSFELIYGRLFSDNVKGRLFSKNVKTKIRSTIHPF
ncbi:MAG: hypothetical protein AAGJ34_05050 [Pseudomonadota bacterium]